MTPFSRAPDYKTIDDALIRREINLAGGVFAEEKYWHCRRFDGCHGNFAIRCLIEPQCINLAPDVIGEQIGAVQFRHFAAAIYAAADDCFAD